MRFPVAEVWAAEVWAAEVWLRCRAWIPCRPVPTSVAEPKAVHMQRITGAKESLWVRRGVGREDAGCNAGFSRPKLLRRGGRGRLFQAQRSTRRVRLLR